jgi:hypothetical protein
MVQYWGEVHVVVPQRCRLQLSVVNKNRVSPIICDRASSSRHIRSLSRYMKISGPLIAAEG